MVNLVKICGILIFSMLMVSCDAAQLDLPKRQTDSAPFAPQYGTAPNGKSYSAENLNIGQPIYIRVFKMESRLEIWMQDEDAQTHHLHSVWEICAHSGKLGPKLKQGDRQVPEGFYEVKNSSLNPNSRFHLSMNIGYPNAYDRYHGRTGDFIMIHGDCVSIGCLAMTDPNIEVIYALVKGALKNGQSSVPVHIFPFIPNAENRALAVGHEWEGFWEVIYPVYDDFEAYKTPQYVRSKNGRYLVTER